MRMPRLFKNLHMKGNERADIFVFATIFDEVDKSKPFEKEVRCYWKI